MSHTTKLKNVEIRDITALRSAVKDLQQEGVSCSLIENATPRMYYSTQHGKCDVVLRLQESQYDVGFDRQEDGTYVPVFDEWGNHVANKLGADQNACPLPTTREGRAQHQIGRLMQHYAKHSAINAATQQGYIVESTQRDDNGNIHLVLGEC